MESQRSASPPSSPLSVLSKTPSPPSSPLLAMDPSKRYPSPTSTAQSGSASPIKSCDAPDEIRVRTDGPPPPKRRRTQPPKERTTDYLDFERMDEGDEEQLERLMRVLRKKKKIVVIAGAGISVSAGIPDFRSSTGLFATLRGEHKLKGSGKHLFDASVYKHDSSTSSFHKMVRELAHTTKSAKPTPFHHLLASLAHEGRLMRLYSQNIDCIETSLQPLATNVPLNPKAPWPTTIQLHGGLANMECTKCGYLDSLDGCLFEGSEPPSCPRCEEHDEVRTRFGGKRSHGIGRLRPRIVLYHEHNPDGEAIGNVTQADLRRVPDCVLVVGTTLTIPALRKIVKEMCQVTRSRRDGFTAWLNIDPEPQGADLKDCWDLVVRGKCDDVAELANLPHWDEQDIGDSWKVTGEPEQEERCKKNLARGEISILLDPTRPTALAVPTPIKEETPELPEQKSKLVQQVQGGIPTPTASPKLRTALPDKPTKAGTKQSKLSFIGSAAKDQKDTSKVVKRKPRQPKKPAVPKTNLAKAFKATKNVSSTGLQTPNKTQAEPDSSDLSSPPDFPEYPGGLPPLRNPVIPAKAALPLNGGPDTSYLSSSPLGHHRRTSSTDTISPKSKPRSMENLID